MAALESHQILIVDDVPANVFMVKSILESEGYSVIGASSAQQAYQAVEDNPIDLILLDVMMPDVNGFEFSRRLQTDPEKSDIPIIFLSALTEKKEVVQGFEAGGVDYIAKPFHKMELLMRVKTHLALNKTRRELREKNLVLERTADELREANLARDKFVSILAHDLKNPFSGMMSLIGDIQATLPQISSQELSEVFQSLDQTSHQVYDLLETLLDWGRTQTGTLVFQFREFLLAEAIEQASTPLSRMLRHKELAFDVDVGTAMLWGDEPTLITVFRNILSNALKFTPRGGHISVTARSEAGFTVVEFRDNGLGIRPEAIPHLFQLDTKISTSGTEKELGTGLGLVLCKEFVERNNGTMEVESQLGKGTMFRLRFPSRKDDFDSGHPVEDFDRSEQDGEETL